MGVVASLNDETESFDTGNDTIAVPLVLETLVGGCTLDIDGFAPDVIKAGHVVIKDNTSENHKPMPVSGDAYATMPAGHSYVGVVISSVRTKKPFVGVSLRGSANKVAAPYTVTKAIEDGLPRINFFKE